MYYLYRAYNDYDDLCEAMESFVKKEADGITPTYSFFQLADIIFLLTDEYSIESQDWIEAVIPPERIPEYVRKMLTMQDMTMEDSEPDILKVFIRKLLETKLLLVEENFTGLEKLLNEIGMVIENNDIFESDLMAEYYCVRAQAINAEESDDIHLIDQEIFYRLKEFNMAKKLQVIPDLRDWYLKMVILYSLKGDILKSVKYHLNYQRLDNYVTIEKDTYEWFSSGAVTNETNEYLIKSLKRLVLRDPNNRKLYYCLALCYWHKKEFEDATECLQYAMCIVNGTVYAYEIVLTDILSEYNQPESIKSLNRIIESLIHDTSTFYNFYTRDRIVASLYLMQISNVCIKLNKTAEAVDVLNTLIQRVDIDDSRDMRCELIELYYAMSKPTMCLNVCREAIRYFPNDAYFSAVYAKILSENGSSEIASNILKNTIASEKNMYEAVYRDSFDNLMMICDWLLSSNDSTIVNELTSYIKSFRNNNAVNTWTLLSDSILAYRNNDYDLAREYWNDAKKLPCFYTFQVNKAEEDERKYMKVSTIQVLGSNKLWDVYIDQMVCEKEK